MAIAHRNLAHLAESTPEELPAAQVWTQCHSYAFDFSVWEIWAALLGGARLVVMPDSVVRSPDDFHAVLVNEHVNVLTQTPSAVAALSPQGLESVAVLLGGEACPGEVVDQWAPGRVVINAYGPTEATVYASMSAPLSVGIGAVPDRCAAVDRRAVRPRRMVTAGAVRCGRRVVCGRPRRGRRICRPDRFDRVTVCGVPVRRRRRTHVSHRGPGAVARRRAAAISRAAPTNRSRSAGTASSLVKSRPLWPRWTGSSRRW